MRQCRLAGDARRQKARRKRLGTALEVAPEKDLRGFKRFDPGSSICRARVRGGRQDGRLASWVAETPERGQRPRAHSLATRMITSL
jgi:hypothetical protein